MKKGDLEKMKKKSKKIGLIICVIMLTMAFITPIKAEEEPTTEDFEDLPVIQLFIVTDGDFITIGDDDILGQIQEDIDNLGGEIVVINDNMVQLNTLINKAQGSANKAFLIADSANNQALTNKELLSQHGNTLIYHYNTLNDTIKKLWILRDEVVAFEGHYFNYIKETNTTLGDLEFSVLSNDEDLLLHGEDIEDLQAKLNDINGVIALVRNTLIGLGLLACGLYLFNRRYPFGQIARNGKGSIKHGKQHKIVDYTPEAANAKGRRKVRIKRKKKPKTVYVKKVKHNRHIRRNPQKSPAHFLFSFFHKL